MVNFGKIFKPVKKVFQPAKKILTGISGVGGFGGGRDEFDPSSTVPELPAWQQPYIPGISSPDMSSYYDTMAKNQEYQNEISRGQLELAQKQSGIAGELYEKGKKYRPLESEVIKSAKTGLDPSFFGARARNAILQSAAGAPQKLMAAAKRKGMSASSPAAIAQLQAGERGLGQQAAAAGAAEEGRIRDFNLAQKAQALGLGANIPAQVSGAYGQAAGVMGSAGEIAQKAASALANQYATEQQFAMQQQQNAANAALAQQTLGLQQRQLQEQMRQSQIEINWREYQAKQAYRDQMWGAIPVAGPIINLGRSVGGGTFICTELLRQGKVDPRLYELASIFDSTLSRYTIDGYQCWSFAVAMHMRSSMLTTLIAGSLAHAYMSYAASRVLGASKPLVGRLVYIIGAPICNVIGRVRRLLGYNAVYAIRGF